LCKLRSYFYFFNPICLHYCYKKDKLNYIFVEVSNIPWLEKTKYILPIENNKIKENCIFQKKKMHVSPFNPHNNQIYQFITNLDNQNIIDFKIRVFDAKKDVHGNLIKKKIVMSSILYLKKSKFKYLRYPNNYSVVLKIHWKAFLLWIKNYKLYYHPKYK
jgi:DUF1365 family protein